MIELIITLAILGVVMSALVGLLFASMAADKQAKGRLDGTRDEQFTAVYFAPDVQGSTTVVQSVTARCGTGSALVEFRGETFDPVTLAGRLTVVSYVFRTQTVDGVLTGRLERRSCEAAASPAPTYPLSPASTQTVARTLAAVPPALSCAPSPCSASTRSVSLVLSRQGGEPAFTLNGSRRAS